MKFLGHLSGSNDNEEELSAEEEMAAELAQLAAEEELLRQAVVFDEEGNPEIEPGWTGYSNSVSGRYIGIYRL
jgi:hypothetical protein